MIVKIVRPFYDSGGRKYVLLESNEVQFQVKVPFRYNRVMCSVEGLRPIQEYQSEEYVDVEIERKVWEGDIFYILKSLKPLSTC